MIQPLRWRADGPARTAMECNGESNGEQRGKITKQTRNDFFAASSAQLGKQMRRLVGRRSAIDQTRAKCGAMSLSARETGETTQSQAGWRTRDN